jgi:hypothetical protein
MAIAPAAAMKPHPERGEAPPLRRRRIKRAAKDVEKGLKDTERRGVPSDLPRGRGRR